MSQPRLEATVHCLRREARNTLSVELRPLHAGQTFPSFAPGAHIDLHLAPGLVRSYSLLNDPAGRERYVIAVLLDANSRGGSRHVHEQLRVGSVLALSAPRNHFALDTSARRSVLVAGGIGITPLLAMWRALVQLGREVRLLYCARSRADAAFLDDIAALAGPHASLHTHFDDEQGGPPKLEALLAGEAGEVHFYACGPAPMLAAFESACARLGYAQVHIERFAAAPAAHALDAHSAPQVDADTRCTLTLQRSGQTVLVPAGQSMLDALLAAGVDVEHSCKEGVCGSCETRILAGEVEHRDSILTKAERAAGKSLMVCVSRCKGSALVLDL